MRHQIHALACAILAVTVAGLAGPAPAAAQNPPPAAPSTPMTSASFAKAVGKKVYMTTTDGRYFEGKLESAKPGTPGSITISGGHNKTEFPLDQVRTVKRVTHRVRNGLLIGLGPGLAIGFAASGGDDSGTAALMKVLAPPLLGMVAGAAVGGILNHAKRDRDLIYDKNRKSTTTVSLAPIISPTRKGAAFAVSWR